MIVAIAPDTNSLHQIYRDVHQKLTCQNKLFLDYMIIIISTFLLYFIFGSIPFMTLTGAFICLFMVRTGFKLVIPVIFSAPRNTQFHQYL